MQPAPYTLIGPFSQLLHMQHLPPKGPIKDEALQPIEMAGLLVKDGTIEAVDVYEALLPQANAVHATYVNMPAGMVALPGLIDAHTHICFAGSRANDYALRNAGKTYLEIAAAGGGIWQTVQHTRQATLEQLAAFTAQRAQQHLLQGITTMEVKSGYGLSVHEELKMLRAIKMANQQSAACLVPTCLAAHMLPRDFKGTHSNYLEHIATSLFPVLQAENLTNRIDAFIEESAFSAEDIAPYFTAAKAQGFQITVHADQFTPGGSAVATELNAASADHLEASGQVEIDNLAASPTVAVALPGASLGLGEPFAPARKLLDAGACLAIATDYNPGSAPMGQLLVQAAILGTFQKLTNAEVLAGITVRAAQALQLADRGILAPGCRADIAVFSTPNYQEILYRQGRLQPSMVFKNGLLVVDNTHPQ